MGSSPIFRIIKLKRVKPYGLALFDFRSGSGPCPHGSKVSAPLRSAQSRHPPDVLRPIFRRLRSLRGRRPWFKVSPPARSARGMRSPGPHSVSALLRSLQNRRPPDVLQPIFRKASVVAGQALYNDKTGKVGFL